MASLFAAQRLIPFLTLALMACSTSSPGADAGDAGSPSDAIIPFSCGATEDCVSAGLDADTCTYPSAVGNCGAVGQCQVVTIPADISSCSEAQEFCPCSGETQMIPPCWPKGFSPAPVSMLGPCPPDSGS